MMSKKLKWIIVICILFLSFGASVVAQGQWIDLFNGHDLSGWTAGGTPWTVRNGTMVNTQGYESDWIRYDTLLPSTELTFEMRFRMISGMRLRTHISFDNIYIGNEGSIRQIEVYGRNVANVSEVGDDSYNIAQWYTLQLVINPMNHIELYKDGILTHTATRMQQKPTQIVIVPGDHWSPGIVEISSIRYYAVPEPSSILTLLCGISCIGGMILRRRKLN